MQEQKKGYQFSTGLIAGVSSVLIIAGGFAAWWAWTALKGEDPPTWVPEALQSETNPTDTKQEDPPPVTTEPEGIETQVYWLKVTDNNLELAATPMRVEKTEQPNLVIEKALTHLLSQTPEGDYASTIPKDTQLRSVSFREDGIHIDLSEDFTFGGGSTSMIGRVGQILYTATSLNPEAEVWLEIQGQPIEYLGGEGLYIPQPLTREKFQANYQL